LRDFRVQKFQGLQLRVQSLGIIVSTYFRVSSFEFGVHGLGTLVLTDLRVEGLWFGV